MKQSLTLYELNSLVRQSIALTMPDAYWVEAELSELREVRGHCYMELVEKDEYGNTPVAKASAKCWKNTWMFVRQHFERVTGRPMRPGMKVLLKVTADFHEAYGFSWIVNDINPEFTMGDMARRRQEIIRQLKAEGVFELQKELSLPMFAQRVAVISSANAAGYGDFCHQLSANEDGLWFAPSLFPATMQGEAVSASVIRALNEINLRADDFDVVVIIRGGGATSDLSGFDTLELAENVANFPLPVITGIGHERDQNVLDLVAFRSVKTPTAAAALLVDHLSAVYGRVTEAQERLVAAVDRRMEVERLRLQRLGEKLPIVFSLFRERQEAKLHRLFQAMTTVVGTRLAQDGHRLELLERRLRPAAARRLEREEYRLRLLQQRAVALDPALLLKRGYSITTCKGSVVRDAGQLSKGDEIVTRLEKGSVKSIIK